MESDNSSDENIMSQDRYLSEFNSLDNGPLHEQEWAVKNIQNFHKLLQLKYFNIGCAKKHGLHHQIPEIQTVMHVHVMSETSWFP